MRRGAVFLAAAAAAVVALIGVAPAMFQPTGHRLAMTEKPSDYGLPDTPVTFSPRDRPITLRAWWIPAAAARGALVFVHGGGDDNRNLPYGSGLALARDLAAAGYALLMVDLRNFGESEGTAEGITFVLLIHDAHDPIAPVDDCRRLAAAIPNASTWITELENPGAFGTHIQAYRLGPQAYVARVTEFLDRALRGRSVARLDGGR